MLEALAAIIFLIWIFRRPAGKQKKIRKRKPPFKTRYGLNQIQPIGTFERKMVHGMFNEGREVFVTAFVNDTHVLRVTATIGSKYSCHASDDVTLWGEKACEIGATKIRQYHNHPAVYGRSRPSQTDRRTNASLKSWVAPWGVELQSILVYKSRLGSVVMKEYQ